MNLLRVLRPGVQASLQDLGRRGVQGAGLASGGAADEHAFRWANRLLDNPQNAACIEILVGQFSAEFNAATTLALSGADMRAQLNGRPLAKWVSHPVQPGDRLDLHSAQTGLRAYLAVAGGWQTPQLFGSRATVLREGLGGLNGGPLQSGDVLPYGPSAPLPQRQINPSAIVDYAAPLRLALLPGYQHRLFDANALHTFTNSTYRVSQRIDRMGYCLTGPKIQPPTKGVISEGIAFGAVQITGDGEPIVLLRDRQTIGGYPKLGCVTAWSCSQLSQRGPGAEVQFYWVDLAEAQRQYRAFYGVFGDC